MKNRRILYYCLNFVAIVLVFGVLSAIYAYSNGYTNKFYISLAIAIISLILFVILFIQYNFANHELKVRWVSYLTAKLDENVDFENELQNVISNFDSDKDKQKNIIPKPNFYGTKRFCDYRVIKNGSICYGCLVEANLKLFSPSKFVNQVLPAVLVYSYDEFYSKNPCELKNIARVLFNDRNNNFLKNEKKYFANIPVSNKITADRKVYVTTIMVCRRHLPLGGFPSSHLILPVIANPDISDSVFIVDSKYWTKNLIASYLSDIKLNKIAVSEEMPDDKVESIFGELINSDTKQNDDNNDNTK